MGIHAAKLLIRRLKDKYSKSSWGGEGETWGRTGGGSCLVSGPQAAIWTGRGQGGAPVRLFGGWRGSLGQMRSRGTRSTRERVMRTMVLMRAKSRFSGKERPWKVRAHIH